MSVPLSFNSRIGRQWAEYIDLVRRIRQIVAVAELTLHRAFNDDGSLIPVPVRAVVNRRRRDRF
jgi:hypothetical protein